MRALAHMIMGPADRNQDLSQRSQLTPSPPSLIMHGLLHWLFTDRAAQLSSICRLMLPESARGLCVL